MGSGALKIGEAGEFDYSGSQAIKALKEEGIEIILVNPNIATIQTSEGLADKVYFLPVNADFVEKVIELEKPGGILLGFGGQTALNCGVELYKRKILQKHKIKVLGTSVKTIIETEDRQLFVEKLKNLNLNTPKSIPVTSVREGLKKAGLIGFPVIIRGAFALGGAGSGLARNKEKLKELLEKAFAVCPQILMEEYLGGWKEIEYEVVRDQFDNCITVCNMENLDPMGIHTGESVVVAPSQTLSNNEYFKLREIAINCIKGLAIIGECNIQFAVNPRKFAYRIIEVNARLSRSSALASKATGYPLAFVATKLALGFSLSGIKNSVTGATCAFFEPALDYIVTKIPRWDLTKFQAVHEEIGTEMKSVGEVMAIGRTFEESMQKAVRSLNLGYEGIIPIEEEIKKYSQKEILALLKTPKVGRINLITIAFIKGVSVSQINKITHIDPWFLTGIKRIVDCYQELKKNKINPQTLLQAKKLGFSDRQIANLNKTTWQEIRALRKKQQILPRVFQIDTLAGEFPAKTNYLYLTYNGQEDNVSFFKRNPPSLKLRQDLPCRQAGNSPYESKNIAVLGSGPYHIGSSVEFDWCGVTTAKTLKELGFATTVINCNPETVSTDYDISDRLYFEELTLERVLDIYEKEHFQGIILSVGGQIPNNLASPLKEEKVPIIGTDPINIDQAEDRNKFSHLLDKLKIPQPYWESVISEKQALKFAQKVSFPVLLRPSYVLSGTSMRVIYTREDLIRFLQAIEVNKKYPLVISQFIRGAAEAEIDAISQDGQVIAYAVLTHVEEAGVHSGDATIILGQNNLKEEIVKRMEEITYAISKNLNINGPFNIQFLVKHGIVLVIECNLRASRSFPFTSKVTGVNLIKLATEAIFKKEISSLGRLIPKSVGVKAAQFSFGRLRGADPILQIEMASTGEVGCFGKDVEDAYLKAALSVGLKLPKRNIFLTIGNYFKEAFLPYAKLLNEMAFRIYATEGTNTYLQTFGIPTIVVKKGYEGGKNNSLNLIKNKKVDFIINLRDSEDTISEASLVMKERSDGYQIRRAAADHNLPLVTNFQIAKLLILALYHQKQTQLTIASWDKYLTGEV